MRTSWSRGGVLAAALLAVSTVGGPAHAAPGPATAATGSFVADVDFASLQATDVRGNKCEFRVDGTLTFSGTLEGVATGTTTAVIFAPCADALAQPPGSFFDTFRFEGRFTGEVGGTAATGPLSYAGLTRVGGDIDARVRLNAGPVRAVLRADAQVAVGGTYSGVAQTG
jgi:hypothetical protein